jgi:hypothetical protein
MPKISDIQETPNPNAVKFILREPVSHGVAQQFASVDQAQTDTLAKSLSMLAVSCPFFTWTI